MVAQQQWAGGTGVKPTVDSRFVIMFVSSCSNLKQCGGKQVLLRGAGTTAGSSCYWSGDLVSVAASRCY